MPRAVEQLWQLSLSVQGDETGMRLSDQLALYPTHALRYGSDNPVLPIRQIDLCLLHYTSGHVRGYAKISRTASTKPGTTSPPAKTSASVRATMSVGDL
jgi:hypothetical protein